MGGLVCALVVVVLLAVWVSWTGVRLGRLNTRVEEARGSLDAQLVRRSAALRALLDSDDDLFEPERSALLRRLVRQSLDADPSAREVAENDLSRALQELPTGLDPALLTDLADAARRVAYARRFHNDAVRDTRALRRRRLPRLFRLGARRALPAFFEIDDTVPPSPATALAPAADRTPAVVHPAAR